MKKRIATPIIVMGSISVTVNAIPLTGFTINCPSSINGDFSQTADIIPTPSNATYVNNTDLTWTSSNSSILSVSADGVITSHSYAGTCTITATHKTYTNLSESIGISVDGYIETAWYGQEYDYYLLYICPEDTSLGYEDGYYDYGSEIPFSSAAEQSAWASGISQYEEEDYYGYHCHGYNTWSDGLSYPEYVPLQSFTISCQTTMDINSSHVCNIINPIPSAACDVENTNFIWTSNNTSIATVSPGGVITSYSTNGSCTITASHKIFTNVSHSFNITVSGISLTGFTVTGSTSMYVSSSQTCCITPTPSNASNRSSTDFTWTSSNTSMPRRRR